MDVKFDFKLNATKLVSVYRPSTRPIYDHISVSSNRHCACVSRVFCNISTCKIQTAYYIYTMLL